MTSGRSGVNIYRQVSPLLGGALMIATAVIMVMNAALMTEQAKVNTELGGDKYVICG